MEEKMGPMGGIAPPLLDYGSRVLAVKLHRHKSPDNGL